MRRSVARAVAFLCVLAVPAMAQTARWVNYAMVSPTTTLTAGRLCATDGRDIYCDATLPLATGGLGLADRLTSGTRLMVLNSGTGVVSLSSAGTDWGYLNPTGQSYLPAFNTNGISATSLEVSNTLNDSFNVGFRNLSDDASASMLFSVVASSTALGVNLLPPNSVLSGGPTRRPGGVAFYTSLASTGGMTFSARNPFASLYFYTGGTTLRMRLDETGKLGLGIAESTPSATLHVSGTAFVGANQPAIYTSVTPTLVVGQRPGDGFAALTLNPSSNTAVGYSLYANSTSSYGLYAHAAGTYPMIARGGNVGINMPVFGTTPSASLHVSGAVILAAETSATLDTCDTSRRGAIKYQSGDFSVCRNGSTWETLTSITGGGGATDRLTSGTSIMALNSATGIVSLTMAGTDWAYLHPTLGLVAPGVSTTGPISGTSGYFSAVTVVQPILPSGSSIGLGSPGGSSGVSFAYGDGSGGVLKRWDLRLASDKNFYVFDSATGGSSGSYRMTFTPSGTVGIATGSVAPSATLHVSGTGYFTGNVGIGTSSPSSTLSINSPNNINSGSGFADQVGALFVGIGRDGILFDGNQIERTAINPLYVNYNSSASLGLNYGGGNVGIGMLVPAAQLDVSGTVSATGIKLAMASTTTPPSSQCAGSSDYGRMMRGGDGRFYLCVER